MGEDEGEERSRKRGKERLSGKSDKRRLLLLENGIT
uniref:Uncharacterized protein n=1 Tax=Nelumbo nucifera TaxID=4432 RepID=A0A822X9D5_NELNU|nr:TPA_asm: hypothetical protein HUJ06_019537 [Nelumbo nucifera]